MTDKEREANEMVEEILRQLREKRQGDNVGGQVPPAELVEPSDGKTSVPMPPAPQIQNPALSRDEPCEEPPKKPSMEEIFPEPSLPETPLRTRGLEEDASQELIDDRFREFFTRTVAVDRNEIRKQTEKKEKKPGFLARLFSHLEDDEDDDYDDYE
ncbi:MAG: hypothetical protein RR075_05510, partial [Pygmaiobacter sp.]